MTSQAHAPRTPRADAPSAAGVLDGFQPSFEDLGTPLREVTFVVVDLETTGTRAAESGITEIGAVKVRGGEVLGEFQSLVNPGREVPAFVARLTGITTAMVATAPPVSLVLPSFLEWARGAVLVAHNAPFDVGFLKAAAADLGYEWPGFAVVDTVPLARRVVTRDEVPNHKLSTLATFFRARVTPEHRALADARATVDVLHGLLDRLGATGVTHLEDLAGAADPVPPDVRKKRHLADGLPEAPGVYLFRGPGDEVLYVGTSTNIRKRVRSYFTAAEKRRRITEMVRIAHAVTPVVCATPLEAAVRELRLIAQHEPRYNRRSKHPERQTWVRLTDEAYPRLSVVRDVRAGTPHIGPFSSRRSAQEAVEALHDALPLRQCTLRLAAVSRSPGSPCALAGMGRCSAPCTAVGGPDTAYADVARSAALALTDDPSPVVSALAARVARLAAEERFEEAGLVTRRLRSYVQGAGRAQRLAPLAACSELVAARPTAAGGWELVVVRHARLAGTAVTRPGEDPLPVVDALRATAEVVEPPVAPAPACHPEEAALVIDWLEQPGVRLVHASQPWSVPVRSALAHADLAGVSGEVRAQITSMAPC
ncbi:DEDD exnuclease domain-containing protein [Xylanimonas oleitrophica]|uniref:DEDD exnuclease domain-containing protein n=1 Tax=Xylanimonas oleitrophica TaxID=2607479 RepID=A0A2W5Y6G2_9MICO|nr:DEDD exonuclease domain-containing protein [Xylanimonas oleitrophica]PZR53794.1 DEDD exnuclease domain-containing protein [Xylanimonas oleitrophica]